MKTNARKRHRHGRQGGFGLIEVMLAMVIVAFAILGVLGTFQWSEHGLRAGLLGTRALAVAQTRVEAKRTIGWNHLLEDDLDGDGRPDLIMRDDGQAPDDQPGDGTYTASATQSGIHVVWSLRAEPPGPLQQAGLVLIDVRARYSVDAEHVREVRLAALRGNPANVGGRP